VDYNPLSPAIRDILTAIRHRKSLEDVVALILDRSCQLADAVHGSFVKVDPDARELLITCVHGPDWTPEKQGLVLKVGEGITGKVAETGIPYLCADTSRDPDYYPLFDYVRSELVVPVMGDDRVWGIINLDGLEPNAFDANTLSSLRVFGELCAFAINLRREMLEQERWQARALKHEKLAALGEVIAGIAHEINNPLTSILGHANLLSLRHELLHDPSVQGILTEARRTADLVRSLLTFSRQDDLEKRIIDVCALVRSVSGIKQYHLRVNNITMEVDDCGHTPCPVRANAQQLQQVLLNLLNNAVQAIPEDRADGNIRVKVARRGEQVLITVEDNGIGISEEVQDQLFDPFFTTREIGQGRGLGLTIAHTILEQHGGGLSFDSLPAGGTRFTIHLPVAHDPTPEQTELGLADIQEGVPARDGAAPAANGNGKRAHQPEGWRILVVDDEPLILETLEAFLSASGLRPELARDGSEALERLREHDFDVILSDIRMPGMDGLAFYTAARELNERYGRHFLFMSGDLVREDTRAFVAKSGCPVLEKPFQMHQLLELLAQRAGAEEAGAGN